MKIVNILCGVLAAVFLLLGGGYVTYNKLNEDKEAPVFHMESETLVCGIDATQEELRAGLTASDNKDGDLTDHIIVSEIRIHEEEAEDDEIAAEEEQQTQFDISYLVFDSSNNKSSLTRTLIYEDYHSPRFQITRRPRFASISAVDLYGILEAEDCIDGDISNQITIEMGNAYLNAISYGTYDCTLQVTNSLGDTATLPMTFEIYDSTSQEEVYKPDVRLTTYLVYLERGEQFDPMDYLHGMYLDGDTYYLTEESELDNETVRERDYGYSDENYQHFMTKSVVSVKSNVDTSIPGTYTVKYSYSHPEKGITGTTELPVIVE